MNRQVKELDVVQFLLYLWERVIIVLLVSVICALLLMGRNYKQQKSITPTARKQGVINAIIAQNHDAFYAPTAQPLQYTFEKTPSGSGVSVAKLYVDFNFDSIEGNTSCDYSQMSYRAQQDANVLLVSIPSLQNVIDKLNLKQYEDLGDISADRLRWMVSSKFYGSNVMQVYVTDVDPDRAAQISKAVIEEFLNSYSDTEIIDKVEVIDEPNIPVGTYISDDIIIAKSSLIKNGILGAIAGFVAISGLFLFIFLMKEPIRSYRSVEKNGLSVFGTVAKKQDNKIEDYKRIAYKLSALNEGKVVSFIPTDKKTEGNNIVSGISKELLQLGLSVGCLDTNEGMEGFLSNLEKIKKEKDIILIDSRNIKDFSDGFLVSMNSDLILLETTFGVTKEKELRSAMKTIENIKKEISGVIINNSKY